MSVISDQIDQLIHLSKYLEAEALYLEHEEQLSEAYKQQRHVQQLLQRAPQIRKILSDLNVEDTKSSNNNATTTTESEKPAAEQQPQTHQTQTHHPDADWILGMTYLGITTHYKVDDTTNNITIKIEGILDNVPLFEQAAVLYEVDLFKTWVPLLRQSLLIDRVSTTEIVTYLMSVIPPLSRDTLIQAYAVDCLESHDRIVLCGASVDDWPPFSSTSTTTTKSNNITDTHVQFGEATTTTTTTTTTTSPSSSSSLPPLNRQPLAVPWYPIGWFHNKMTVSNFTFVLQILDKNRVQTSFIGCIDPNAPIPRTILNILIRNIAGLFLYFFQQQAHKVGKTKDCAYVKRIKENTFFYRDWIYPKMKEYYQKKGWELDPNIEQFF